MRANDLTMTLQTAKVKVEMRTLGSDAQQLWKKLGKRLNEWAKDLLSNGRSIW